MPIKNYILAAIVIYIAIIIYNDPVSGQTLIGSCPVSGITSVAFSDNDSIAFATSHNEIYSINISNRANPIVIDSLQYHIGDYWHIFISDGYVYLTGWTERLFIVDVHDPYNLLLVSSYQPPRNISLHCCFVRGNFAYVSSCEGFLKIDVTDKAHPFQVFQDRRSMDGYGIWLEGNYAYIPQGWQGSGASRLYVYNVADSTNPFLISSPDLHFGYSHFLSSLNHFVYIPSEEQHALKVVDATDPYNPVVTDSIGPLGTPYKTFELGNYLFVAAEVLFIYDISDQAHPRMFSGYSIPDCHFVVANDHYIYLAANDQFIILEFDATSINRSPVYAPDKFGFVNAYPNPFNTSTSISYSLSKAGSINLAIYNLLGQKVATLFDGIQQAGEHSIIWDANDCPSGVYFAKLESNEQTKKIKMVLMK